MRVVYVRQNVERAGPTAVLLQLAIVRVDSCVWSRARSETGLQSATETAFPLNSPIFVEDGHQLRYSNGTLCLVQQPDRLQRSCSG